MSYQTIEGYMQRGMWEDAIVECQAVLQVQPVNAKLWAYLGVCYFRKSEWENAAAALRRAVVLDPKFVDAGIKLAQALDKLGRYLEAYDVADEFLKVRPGDRMLEGIRFGLEHHLRERRIDGWERSIRVEHTIIENIRD